MSIAVKLQFDKSTTDALEAWQQSIRDNAINIIQKTLPEKILSLNAKIAEIDTNKEHLFRSLTTLILRYWYRHHCPSCIIHLAHRRRVEQ